MACTSGGSSKRAQKVSCARSVLRDGPRHHDEQHVHAHDSSMPYRATKNRRVKQTSHTHVGRKKHTMHTNEPTSSFTSPKADCGSEHKAVKHMVVLNG